MPIIVPQELKTEIAKLYIYTDLTMQELAGVFGVCHSSVGNWARQYRAGGIPQRQPSYKHAERLLLALDILEAMPNIREAELAEKAGVSRPTISYWRKTGKIEMDIQCDICGEPTTTKYCKACTTKGWHTIVWKYGLTHDQLVNLPTACEICGDTENLHIDHDHDTGKYRGVLCHHCNVGIGHLKEKKEILENAIKYLTT